MSVFSGQHQKEYTIEEQQLDIVQANLIYDDTILRHDHYSDQDYEFLFALLPSKLNDVFNEIVNEENIILTLMAQGHLPIFQSLFEKLEEKERSAFLTLFEQAIIQENNQEILRSTLSYCLLRDGCNDLSNIIYRLIEENKIQLSQEMFKKLLKQAAKNNHPQWVDLLLKSAPQRLSNFLPDVNNPCFEDCLLDLCFEDILLELHQAAKNGFIDVAEKLSRFILDNSNSIEHYSRVLACLIQLGDIKILEEFFNHDKIKLQSNAEGETSRTPVTLTLKNHELYAYPTEEVARFILEKITVGCNQRVMNILLDCGSRISAPPLHVYTQLGFVNMVRVFLNHPKVKIDVNLQFKGEIPAPLVIAAELGFSDVARELLLHQEIDVNIKSACTRLTPLQSAAAGGHVDIIAQLLQHSQIRVDLKNPRDYQALSLLKRTPEHQAILEHFLKTRYVADYQNRRSDQPDYLHWYGRLFGYSKAEKVAAAEKIKSSVEEITNPDAAMRQGELGAVYSLLRRPRP